MEYFYAGLFSSLTVILIILGIKVIRFFDNVNKLLVEEVKPTVIQLNNTLKEGERTLSKATIAVDSSSQLISKFSSFTEKGATIKGNITQYFNYAHLGFELLQKIYKKNKNED